MKTRPAKRKDHPKPPAQPRAAAEPAWRRLVSALPRPGWPVWGLLLLAFAAFLPALWADFIWDDDALTENYLVKTVGGLWNIWFAPGQMPRESHYWPLVYSSFWLEHLLFGMHSAVFHFNNILLHALTAILLWRVLLRLGVPGAWLAAALFAVHPVHVESVAWVIERKDVLSGALFMGSILAWLRFDSLRHPQSSLDLGHLTFDPSQSNQSQISNLKSQINNPQSTIRIPQSKWYALAFLLFIGALFSKSIVVGLPLVLALLAWWRRGRLTRRDLVPLIPMVLWAVVVTLADAHHTKIIEGEPAESITGVSLPWRLLLAARAFWFYLGKLAFPLHLATFYPRWRVAPPNPAGWVALAAILGLLAVLWAARRRLGRGPLVSVLYFGVMVGPALGIVEFSFMGYAWVADRFQYLASAGPLALAAAALTLLALRLRWSPGILRWTSAALLGLLGILCFAQTTRYHDSLRLFRAAVADGPQSWPAHLYVGYALLDQNRNTEALAALEEALRVAGPKPDYNIIYNLALTHARLGHNDEADLLFRRTLEVNPLYLAGRNNYGVFLERMGRPAEAEAQYREVIRKRPDYSEAYNNLGNMLKRQNKLDEAGACLRKAVELSPENAVFQNNLAMLLVRRGDYPRAMTHFEAALKANPNYADGHNNMGQFLLELGRPREAVEHFEAFLRLHPNSPPLLAQLGGVYESLGQTAEAVRCYRQALRLDPGHAEAAQRLSALGAPPQ